LTPLRPFIVRRIPGQKTLDDTQLADRREELTRQRVQTVNRLQRLLSELIPGKGKKDLTVLQAKAILDSVRPRDLPGKTRRRLAVEQLAELVAVEKKIKALTAELKQMVKASGSGLMTYAVSGRSSPPGSWPTSATSPGSPTATGRLLDRLLFATENLSPWLRCS
jgi:hypothetical protein